MSDPASDENEGFADWLASYDDALMRGETVPSPPRDASGPEADRFRAFLDALDRSLRPPISPVTLDAESTEGATPTRADSRLAGESIGRFMLEEELGRGGFGVVYRAFDPTMGRWVALKVPRADPVMTPDVRRRFLREAHAAAQLDHPNLVPVFEVGEAGPVCYIASAFCEGPTLRRWIKDGGAPASPRQAARLSLALARAIEHMHVRGLLHCDLKPENVLLDMPPADEAEADPTPRVTDFGLARLAEAATGESTAARPWGTPPYMAPEQIEQRREAIGPPTDVYALGAILYELLTGRRPHSGENAWELMRSTIADIPPAPRRLLRSVPRDLDAIALKCLEKRPELRYSRAADLADDLERYLDRRPTRARPLGATRRLIRWSRRNKPATALILMGLATTATSVVNLTVVRRAFDDLKRSDNEVLRANSELRSTDGKLRQALADMQVQKDLERSHQYVATLPLAQDQIRRGQWMQAQRSLRQLIPSPGSDERDRRDFAWHYLWQQSRRDRTLLYEMFPGGTTEVSAGLGHIFATNEKHQAGMWRVVRPNEPGVTQPGVVRPILTFAPYPNGDQPDPVSLQNFPQPGRAVAGRYDGSRGGVAIVELGGATELAWNRRVGLKVGTIAVADDGAMIAVSAGKVKEPEQIVRILLDLEGQHIPLLGIPMAQRFAFLADGRGIASTRYFNESPLDRLLEIWDAKSRRRIVSRTFETITPALAASPLSDGPIATGTMEGVVQLREPRRGAVVVTLPAPETSIRRVDSLAFSRDGRLLAAGYDRKAILWDVKERRPAATIDDIGGWAHSIAFLAGFPDDIALGMSTGEVIVWHTKAIEDATVVDAHADEVWGLAYDGEGRIATLGGDNLLTIRDPATGGKRLSLAGHEAWPSCLASSSSTGRMASGDFGGRVLIWDVKGNRKVHNLKAHDHHVRGVAFSPDGSLLATVGKDKVVRLWNPETGETLATLTGHDQGVRGVSFSPDGMTLATAAQGVEIILWDVRSRSARIRVKASTSLTVLAFSPDGRTLASGDVNGAVTLWNPEDGSMRAHLSAVHSREVGGLAFSPDGRILAVGGQDSLISLIDVESAQVHLTLDGHRGGVNALAFSPDGRTLASVSHDKTLRLWWAGPEMPAQDGPSNAGGDAR